MPKRIQMTRTKGGWRSDNPDAVIVARPSKWGNPFAVGDDGVPDRKAAVDNYEYYFGLVAPVAMLAELRGKDLACWCPLDAPCHADVLIARANVEVKYEEQSDG